MQTPVAPGSVAMMFGIPEQTQDARACEGG